MDPAARSIAFFSRDRSSMTTCAAIALLIVLALLAIGGSS